jgi:hypothetical protein
MKLTDEIIRDFVESNSTLNERTKKIVIAFINQIVEELFGSKDIKIGPELDIAKVKVGASLKTYVSFYGRIYAIQEFASDRITISDRHENVMYSISFNHPKKVSNTRMEYNTGSNVIKVQTVDIKGDKEEFSYVEYVQDEGKNIQTTYTLTPIGVKNKNKEYFELTSSLNTKKITEKSLIKRIVDSMNNGNMRVLETSYEITDLLDYIPEVFSIINEEVEKDKSLTR